MSDCKSNERCVLCLDEKRSPVRINCGHSFCHECLDVYKSYQKYTWANKCPICRCALKEKKRLVKRILSSPNDNVQNRPENATNAQSSSSETNIQREQNSLLEEFIAIATNDCETSALVSLNIEHLNYSNSTLEDVTPIALSESDDEMSNDYLYDDFNDDIVFSDSDEDTFYYFEDDVSWMEGHEDYEADVTLDPEDSIVTQEGSWASAGSGAVVEDQNSPLNDTNAQIAEDVLIVD